jgi:murein DD-endopeptidase / murein LD-carboxypeptidase
MGRGDSEHGGVNDIVSVDLSKSPLPIPPRFHDVAYNAARFPGARDAESLECVKGFEGGANCQHYAYELIRSFGLVIPNFRSSELWEDEACTRVVTGAFAPLDLLLFNATPEPWGAHVAVYLGEGSDCREELAIHLCRRVARPRFGSLKISPGVPNMDALLAANESYLRFERRVIH